MNDIVLICSVGGSPQPIRTSIDQQQPRFVIYVASPDSRKTIRKDIEPELTWRGIEDTHVITLSDYQDLLACVRDIRHGVSAGLKAMGLPEDSLLVADITGGTKVMSAALTLVMMEYRSRFAYVGGGVRSKNGLGVVESGHETVMKQDNPWEVMALREVRTLARAFNAGNFTAATGLAQALSRKVTGKEKFYTGVKDLVQAYALWDAFDHKGAVNTLRQALGRLEAFAVNHDALFRALDHFKHSLADLEAIQQDAQALRAAKGPLPEGSGQVYLRDLLANAARRAKAGRHDDAVARLYSAIEKSAKIRLMAAHGIDNSHVPPEKIPESLRESLLAMRDQDGVIRIGLQRSFQLLAALRDPLGTTYSQNEAALLKLLDTRNRSLLAHGYNPVSADTAQQLFNLALRILHTDEAALPRFPVMDWQCLLL